MRDTSTPAARMTALRSRALPVALPEAVQTMLYPGWALVGVCGTGLIVAVLDWVPPAEVDVSLFYTLGVAVCAWTRSARMLWLTTLLFIGCTYAGALLGAAPQPGTLWSRLWTNRTLTALEL